MGVSEPVRPRPGPSDTATGGVAGDDIPRRRPAGLGTVFQLADGNWRASIRLSRHERLYRQAPTREAAEIKLRQLLLIKQSRRSTRGVLNVERRNVTRLTITYVLERGTQKKWDIGYAAEVLLASLTPSRIRGRIVGPCFYCGDEKASTVDHMIPLSRGGKDIPGNCVSACARCNRDKADRTTEEWLAFLEGVTA